MQNGAQMTTGVVNIHGREYKTVALRVQEFRQACPITDGWAITTDLVSIDDDRVVMRASILHSGVVVGTGFAEEKRSSSQINRTSALENCETSAIGRALSACGFGGSEYASANEVVQAIAQQREPEPDRTAEFEDAMAECLDAITAIKEGIECGDLELAARTWFSLTDQHKRALWVAPSKGGPFTTAERGVIKSREFRIAHYGENAA